MKTHDLMVGNKYEYSLTDKPKAREQGLVTQELGDETLVYDLEANKAHCLNTAAAIVWNSCDGNSSISEIIVKTEIKEHLVFMALDLLQRCDLINID